MTNNKKIVSLISLLFFILVAVSIYLVIYSLDYRSVLTPFSQGTYVSDIYIGGKTSSQVEDELKHRIESWKKASNFHIELGYQDRSYIIEIDDPEIFSFNLDKTISKIQNGKGSNYEKGINIIDVKFKNDNYLEELFAKHYDKLKFTDFDLSIIEAKLLKNVSFLAKEIYLDLGIALNENTAKENKVGQEIRIKSGVIVTDSRYEILDDLISEYFAEVIEIKGKTQFSFNELLINQYEKYLTNNNFPSINIDEVANIYNHFFTDEELNILATGFYQTILPTNFNNIEKHVSEIAPSYAKENGVKGLLIKEAKVEINYDPHIEKRGNDYYITDIDFENIEDLNFYNPNYHSYYLKVDLINDYFLFQLYGPNFIYDYTIDYERDSYDYGHHIIIERIISYEGIEIDRKVLSEDFYKL